MSADSSGRETRVLSGFSLGGDSSLYCMTADKYAWTHPGWVINSSVIGVFIMQTEIDTPGSHFSGFLSQQERKSHFSTVQKAGVSLKSHLTVLLCYSWKLAALCHIHTQRRSCFSKFPFRRLSEHGFSSVKCTMKVLWIFLLLLFFGKHADVSLLNIVIIESFSSMFKSFADELCLVFNGCIKLRKKKDRAK